jgi:hypothetical protein
MSQAMDEPRNLDVRLLRVFASVYLHHSVSAAARELDMSQPGLSTALMRLRKQLHYNRRLLHRVMHFVWLWLPEYRLFLVPREQGNPTHRRRLRAYSTPAS